MENAQFQKKEVKAEVVEIIACEQESKITPDSIIMNSMGSYDTLYCFSEGDSFKYQNGDIHMPVADNELCNETDNERKWYYLKMRITYRIEKQVYNNVIEYKSPEKELGQKYIYIMCDKANPNKIYSVSKNGTGILLGKNT